MERSLLPVFAILIGLGIVVGLVLNLGFDCHAKSEIKQAIEETINWTNNYNQEALLANINPPELRIFDVVPSQVIEEREAAAQKMIDELSPNTYSLKGFSVPRNRKRIGMSLSVDLVDQKTQEEVNYKFIAINHQTHYNAYRWIIVKLLIEPTRKQLSEELVHQVDTEKRKRNKTHANTRKHINVSVNKLTKLINDDKKEDFLEWVTFDQDALAPSELAAREASASGIFDRLQGSKLAIDQIYPYTVEEETGQIVRTRFKELSRSGGIDEEKLPSGWTGTSKTLALFTGMFILAGFVFMFFKKSTVVRNTVFILFVIAVLLSGLTIYSKEHEKAKYTSAKNYKVIDVLFLEVMNKKQELNWVPAQTIGVKDTQTLKRVVNQEFQKRIQQCGFKMPE